MGTPCTLATSGSTVKDALSLRHIGSFRSCSTSSFTKQKTKYYQRQLKISYDRYDTVHYRAFMRHHIMKEGQMLGFPGQSKSPNYWTSTHLYYHKSCAGLQGPIDISSHILQKSERQTGPVRENIPHPFRQVDESQGRKCFMPTIFIEDSRSVIPPTFIFHTRAAKNH